jgi:hypothetical protein
MAIEQQGRRARMRFDGGLPRAARAHCHGFHIGTPVAYTIRSRFAAVKLQQVRCDAGDGFGHECRFIIHEQRNERHQRRQGAANFSRNVDRNTTFAAPREHDADRIDTKRSGSERVVDTHHAAKFDAGALGPH